MDRVIWQRNLASDNLSEASGVLVAFAVCAVVFLWGVRNARARQNLQSRIGFAATAIAVLGTAVVLWYAIGAFLAQDSPLIAVPLRGKKVLLSVTGRPDRLAISFNYEGKTYVASRMNRELWQGLNDGACYRVTIRKSPLPDVVLPQVAQIIALSRADEPDCQGVL
jgi:hypothetical protein